jgi:predicted nucleotide-binding protein (sugar kinase/HSP70/actin superfamily)
MLGNFIQSIEQGADTVLITGSCGPCRFGEYCELQMQILQKMGYGNLDFIVVDLSHEIGLGEFRRRIKRVAAASPLHPAGKMKALKVAFRMINLCDKIDAKAHALAGYEQDNGACRRVLQEYKDKALLSASPKETLALLQEAQIKLAKIESDPAKDPLKIAIIGEIFTVIEPFSNLYIEEKLMDYGVSTQRMLTPSWWIKNMALKPMKLYARTVYQAAGPYLPFPVGGHGKECIGETILANKHGMDGAIQILPLGCMPEVVAKAIIPTITRDKDFPIMTLIVDETSGEAGYLTRIEAFLDMLAARKKRRVSA